LSHGAFLVVISVKSLEFDKYDFENVIIFISSVIESSHAVGIFPGVGNLIVKRGR